MTDSSYYMHGEHITPTQPSTQDKRKCTPGGNATASNAIKIYFSFMLFDEKKATSVAMQHQSFTILYSGASEPSFVDCLWSLS